MARYEITTLAELQAIESTHLSDDCVLMNDINASDTSNWNVTAAAGVYEGERKAG